MQCNFKKIDFMKKAVVLSFSLFVACLGFSQTDSLGWSLTDCIDYAMAHSISLKQNVVSLSQSVAEVEAAKGALYPSLSFSTSHGLNYRPFQQYSNTVNGTEIISSDQRATYNGNYGINANWTVWSGNRNRNSLRQANNRRQMAEMSVEETENLLREDVARLYVQILYAKENLITCDSACVLSRKNLERGSVLLESGAISKTDFSQLESQVSSDDYQRVLAYNELQNYTLQLRQLLDLGEDTAFSVLTPALSDDAVLRPVPAVQDVYLAAIEQRPELKSQQLNIENSKVDIRVAQSGFMPTLSMSASTSMSTNSASESSWAQQMKTGWNNVVGLSLSVPIYDNHQSVSAVKKAKLQYENAQLEYQNTRKELYKTIETLYLDASSAQQQYLSAKANMQNAQNAYDLVDEQFAVGMKNTVELLTEKNNLISARQQLLQAKYMALLNSALLQFYAGNDLVLF